MKKIPLFMATFLLLLQTACTKKETTFLITENGIGPLQKETFVSDLESTFVNDSIVRDTANLKLDPNAKKIEIFEKGGKHLLTLTANTDSVPTIGNIRINDSRYLTSTGVGLGGTFKDIQSNYSIKKIVTTMNSVVVFPKNSNLYFTIAKSELPSNLRYTVNEIEAVQIPDEAKIKYLMMGWD